MTTPTTASIDIEQINPLNRAALAAWHATVIAADTFGREDVATPFMLPEVEAELASQQDVTRLVYAGIQGGRDVVVSGQIGMPLTHSQTHAGIQVYVHPDHRRRGHGTRMLEHLLGVARGHGRTVVDSEANWPYDAPPDGAGTPGAEFCRAHGFTFGIGDVMRSLDLPVDPALLDRLAADAAPHHAAYELRSFVGPVPDELAEGWARLEASLEVEAPTGELERQPGSGDVGELRRSEDRIAAQGRTKYNTVALTSSGEVVAYTDLAISRYDPTNAFQWVTLDPPPHLGNRRGLAVTFANLGLYQPSPQTATRLRTWNAEVNDHMISVNEALGFRPVGRLGEFQLRLA